MAKGIYVGVAETQKNDIIPKNWSEVTKGTEYKADDGTILTAKNYNIGYADKACDGNENTYWQSSTGTAGKTGWLDLNLSENKKISEMMVKLSSTSTAASVDFTITVMGKLTDDSSWITLNTLNTTVPNNSQPSYTLELSNLDFYKYYRLNLSASDNSIRIYEWQAYEYVIKPGIARKVTKAYVGVAEDSLIVNGDFSDGLEGYTIDTANYSVNLTTLEGKKCVELILTKATTAGTDKPVKPLLFTTNGYCPKGHVCYSRFEYYGNSSNNNLCPLISHTNGTTTQSITTKNVVPGYNVEEWQLASQRTTSAVENPNSMSLVLYAQRADGKLTAGMKMYVTNFKVYDLTEMFGAGNEPTKAWCDDNLGELQKLFGQQNGKARKVKKGYIGVAGVAQLFYSSETLVPFTSNPAPTTWTEITADTDYEASNTYGVWYAKTIYAPTANQTAVSRAFDASTSTYWSATSTTNTAEREAQLWLPQGVSINPTKITIIHQYVGRSALQGKVQGSVDGTDWVDLCTLTVSTNKTTETFDITTETFYKYFRVLTYRYSSSSNTQYVYDFQITAGTLKTE